MNIPTFIAAAVVFLLVIWITVVGFKNRRHGKGVCSCGCQGCSCGNTCCDRTE